MSAPTELPMLDDVMAEFRHIAAGAIHPDATLVRHAPAGVTLVALGIDPKVHPEAYRDFATQRLLRVIFPGTADGLSYASLTRPAWPEAPGVLLVRVEIESLPDVPILLDSRGHRDVIAAMTLPCQVALASRRDVDNAAAMPVEEAVEHLREMSLLWDIGEPDVDLWRMLDETEDAER